MRVRRVVVRDHRRNGRTAALTGAFADAAVRCPGDVTLADVSRSARREVREGCRLPTGMWGPVYVGREQELAQNKPDTKSKFKK